MDKNFILTVTFNENASESHIAWVEEKLRECHNPEKGVFVHDLECAPVMPTLHLNGTGKRMLSEGYENAEAAVMMAAQAVGAIEFNPRDYYPQGDKAWGQAEAHRSAILKAFRAIHKSLCAHLRHIHDPIR